MHIEIRLDEAIAIANANGEGLWDLTTDIRDCGDHAEIWLFDRNEFLGSSNFMDDFEYRNAIHPVEQAVIEQSGNEDFFFDAYDFAGSFVGSISG